MTAWCLPQVKIILFIRKAVSRYRISPENLLPCASREAEPGNFLKTMQRGIRFLFRQSGRQTVPRTLLNAVLYDRVLSVMSLRLMKHEIQHNTIRVFYNQNGEWNRKFKLVYHKNKFLTPAIYELEKLLHTYKNIKLPTNMGILE